MKSIKLVLVMLVSLFAAMLSPIAAEAAPPSATSCKMYNDGSGIDVQLDQFLGQGIDLTPMSDLTVTVNGTTSLPVNFARTYSSVLVVSFYPSVPRNATSLNISYNRTSGGLTNGSGEHLQNFSCNAPVVFGPTFSSATTNSAGDNVVITATGNVQSLPMVGITSAWLVDNGSQVGISSVTRSGSTITLVLSTPVYGGQTVTVSYMAGSGSAQTPLRFWADYTPFPVTNIAAFATPTVTTFSPATGIATGGDTIVITGTNFSQVTSVSIGGVPAASFTIDNATQITAVTGPVVTATLAGAVVVGTTQGQSGTSTANFTYYRPVAPVPPTFTGVSSKAVEPGKSVTITGTSLNGGTVKINGVAAQVTSANENSIQITVPESTNLGSATLEITTSGGKIEIAKALIVVQTGTSPVVVLPGPTLKTSAFIGKFSGTSRLLTHSQKNATKALALKIDGKSVTCTGLIQGKATVASSALARSRATAVCSALKASKRGIVTSIKVAVDPNKLRQARVKVTY